MTDSSNFDEKLTSSMQKIQMKKITKTIFKATELNLNLRKTDYPLKN